MSNISISKKRLQEIIKEEVQKALLEEADQKDEIRELLEKAILQIENGHVELLQDAALILSSQDVNPETLQSILKAQANYVRELKKLQETLR